MLRHPPRHSGFCQSRSARPWHISSMSAALAARLRSRYAGSSASLFAEIALLRTRSRNVQRPAAITNDQNTDGDRPRAGGHRHINESGEARACHILFGHVLRLDARARIHSNYRPPRIQGLPAAYVPRREGEFPRFDHHMRRGFGIAPTPSADGADKRNTSILKGPHQATVEDRGGIVLLRVVARELPNRFLTFVNLVQERFQQCLPSALIPLERLIASRSAFRCSPSTSSGATLYHAVYNYSFTSVSRQIFSPGIGDTLHTRLVAGAAENLAK